MALVALAALLASAPLILRMIGVLGDWLEAKISQSRWGDTYRRLSKDL